MMEITTETDREAWNSAVFSMTTDTFHQSWEWGETYESLGKKVWPFVLKKNGSVIGVCLTILVKARRGNFLLVPHGPLFSEHIRTDELLLSKALNEYTSRLVEIGKEHNCSFIRLAPTMPRTDENYKIFASLGYKMAPIFVQSELSWELDITPEKTELLAGMRKSTRYILKNAESYGVEYKKSNTLDDFDDFYSLYELTVSNQDFVGQEKEFIKQEFLSFSKQGSASLYFVYYKKELLATAMIIVQNGSGFYHYGASKRIEQNIPAPHLLQWYIIQDLKALGVSRYNFWGISPENKPNHPWRGLTLFKRGFGGHELTYLKTQDYILKPSYWLSWIIETIRKTRRGY